MRDSRDLVISGAAIFAALAIPTSSAATSLFFTHNSTQQHRIAQLPTSGGSVASVYDAQTGPFGLAVDVSTDQIYWTDAGTDSVHRAPLNGSGPIENLIADGLFDPHDIELDTAGGKLYFADRMNSVIKRADLDGSDVEVLLNVTLPTYLEVDPIHDKLYFVYGASGPPLIGRSNLDGSDFEVLLSSSSPLHGLALDFAAQRVYFSVRDGAEIHRVDFDGLNEEAFLTGLDAVPLDLAIDASDGTLYWSFFEGMASVPLDDPDAVTTLVTGLPGLSGLSGINGIALDVVPIPEPSTFLLLASTLAWLAVSRRVGR